MANDTRSYNRNYMKEARIERRKLGLCIACGKRNAGKTKWGTKSSSCKKCLKRNAERTLAAHNKKAGKQ